MRQKSENKESKPVPEYKQTWEKIRNDPELSFIINSESYEKAILILLYRIYEKMERS